jgi:hypothetical protein
MPLSYGSIGKVHTPVSNEVVFNRFNKFSAPVIFDVALPILGVSSHKTYFLRNHQLLEINKEAINYKIHGFTAKFGTGCSQTVRLYDQETGQLVAETLAKVDGEFMFQHLHPIKKYTLTTRDEDGILESDIIDLVNAQS